MLGSLTTLTLNGTAASRYRGMGTTFASEKLEDLNRWPTWDPHVCVAAGSTAGSLTSDVQAASVTCNGITDTVDYYDDIAISGYYRRGLRDAVSSIVSSVAVEVYTSTCHTPGGSHNELDEQHIERYRRGRRRVSPTLDHRDGSADYQPEADHGSGDFWRTAI